jgi:predicted P-loop ATPase
VVSIWHRSRDQFWAEAVRCFQNKETWWLDTPDLVQEAERRQAAYFMRDAWVDFIENMTAGKNQTSVSSILGALGFEKPAEWKQSDQNRIAKALTHLGWKRVLTRKKGWVYRRIVPIQEGDRAKEAIERAIAHGEMGQEMLRELRKDDPF